MDKLSKQSLRFLEKDLQNKLRDENITNEYQKKIYSRLKKLTEKKNL
jgi:hypothetical protein